MQSTTNYSMNLVEGTDLVNIPVQLNPNFQTIDQEMFANKKATIGTATEVVTGTVHAVVRANVDADMFRFTATGAWTAGDTMTLDGSAVNVHLADGTAPATGAYIIGAEVVAVVNGTLVTLLTSSGAVDPGVTSFNSRTGAVSPTASDYDASMIDYDNTSSGLVATDVQSAIDELCGGRLIAQSSANAPYSSQLTELLSAYSALPFEKKMRCSLVNTNDNTIVPVTNINDGEFSFASTTSSAHVIATFNMTNGTYIVYSGSYSDVSSYTNINRLALYIR